MGGHRLIKARATIIPHSFPFAMASAVSWRGTANIDGGRYVRSDALDAPALTNSLGSTINVSGKRITGAGNAGSLSDLTTRADLEAYLAGAVAIKPPVRTSSTTTDQNTILTGLMGAIPPFFPPYEVRVSAFTVLLPDTAGNTNSAYFTTYGSLGFVKFYMHVTGFADSPPAATSPDRAVPVSYAAGASAATIAAAIVAVVDADVEFTATVTTSTTVNMTNSIATLTSNGANSTTNMTAVLGGFTDAMSLTSSTSSGYGNTLTGKSTGGVLSLDGVSALTIGDRVLVSGMVEQKNVWTIASVGGANYVGPGNVGTYILMRDSNVNNGGALYIYFKNNTVGSDPAPSGGTLLGFVETSPGGTPSSIATIVTAIGTLIPAGRYTVNTNSVAVTATTKGLISSTALTSLVDPLLGANITLATTNYYRHNGCYVVTDPGAVTPTQWVLTRASDFDGTPANEVVGGASFLQTEGATNSGKQWMLTGTGAKTLESLTAAGDLVFSQVGNAAATYQPPVTYVHKVTSASGGNITAANALELRNLNFATSVNAGLVYNSQVPDGTKYMLGLLPGTYRFDCSQTFANVGNVVCYLIMATTNTNNAAFLADISRTVPLTSQAIATDTGITDGITVDYNGDVTIPSPGRYVALGYVCTSKPAADGLGPINAGSATIGDGTTVNVSYYASMRVTLVSGTGLGNTVAFNSAADVNPLAGAGLVNGVVPRYNTSTGKWEPSALLNDFDGGVPKEIMLVCQIPAGGTYPALGSSAFVTYPLNALEIFNGNPGSTYLTNASSWSTIANFSATGGTQSGGGTVNPNTTLMTNGTSGIISLATGTYNIRFHATFSTLDFGAATSLTARIFNITDSVTVLTSSIARMDQVAANGQTGIVEGEGQIAVTSGPKTFKLEIYANAVQFTSAVAQNTTIYATGARVIIQPVPVALGHTHKIVDLGDVAYSAGPFTGDTLAYDESVAKWRQSSNAGGDVAIYELANANPSATLIAAGVVIPFASTEALTSTANSGMSAPVAGVFTCLKAGVYRVTAEVRCSTNGGTNPYIAITKNFTTGTLQTPTGSASQFGETPLNATFQRASVSDCIPLAVNDTIRLFASGTTGVIESATSIERTRVTVERVQSTASISYGPAALGQLQDVAIAAPQARDRLVRDTAGQWVNEPFQCMIVQHILPFGTAGGTATINAYTARVLNTVAMNTLSGASLSSNQVTLGAGTYMVEFYSVVQNPNDGRVRFTATDLSAQVYSPSFTFSSSNFGANIPLGGKGVLTLTSTKTFELQYYVKANGGGGNSLGSAVSIGSDTEKYAEVIITRI
jgi:hypothetical protein